MPRLNERITTGSAGCFLDPPTFPTHTHHVETDLRRRPENRGWVGLSSAADCTWIAEEVRQEAAALIQAWHDARPAIDSPEIADWIAQVLGYFCHCYIPESGSRNASDLLISRDRDPLAEADRHAGVAFIRNFYPEFTPTAADFGAAYWGTKPTQEVA
jgi:hypothetical protein